jgi:cytochrome c oxidase subunit III
MADAHAKKHDYHIIDPSPWPFIASVGALVMAIGGIAWMRALQSGSFPLFGVDLAAANFWIFLVGRSAMSTSRSRA